MTEKSGENVMIYEIFPCSIPWHYKSARYNVHNKSVCKISQLHRKSMTEDHLPTVCT
jgi:hypothetical protein